MYKWRNRISIETRINIKLLRVKQPICSMERKVKFLYLYKWHRVNMGGPEGADKRTFHSTTQIVCININLVLVHAHRGVPCRRLQNISERPRIFTLTRHAVRWLTQQRFIILFFVSVLLDSAVRVGIYERRTRKGSIYHTMGYSIL